MKSFFNLGLLMMVWKLIPLTHARDIILITHADKTEEAQKISGMIQERQQIPNNLITIRKEVNPCKKSREAILHICLDEKGTSQFLVVKGNILLRSFGIFKQGSAYAEAKSNEELISP